MTRSASPRPLRNRAVTAIQIGKLLKTWAERKFEDPRNCGIFFPQAMT